MNLFSVVERNISAKVVALGTLMALLASAFPVAFFVAEAATVPSTPSSHSIGPNTTVVTTLDTTGFENVTVSFSYDAEQLDTGDELRFGWRPVGGAETQLGFVAGINEVDPVDEIGSFTNVGLGAGAADLGPIEIYFTNTGTAATLETAFVSNIVVSGDALPAACAPQVEPGLASGPVQNANTNEYFTTVSNALADCDTMNGHEIDILANLAINEEIRITRPITIDGNSNMVSTTYTFVNNSAGNATFGIVGTTDVTIKDVIIDGSGGTNLHGINVFESTDVELLDVSVMDNDKSGVSINQSTVTIENITTAGSGWHAINVDKGTATNNSVLTIKNTSVHGENSATPPSGHIPGTNIPHIFIDDNAGGYDVVNDDDGQYDMAEFDIAGKKPQVYTLKAPTAPKKVDICHMTDTGFNLLNVSVNALDGHDGHDDIIPVVPGEHAGLNLSTMYSGLTGAEVLAAGCDIPVVPADDIAPKVTVNDGALTCEAGYFEVSFKLYDAGKIDKVVLNGVEKDLSNNVWSDLNGVKPGKFGAVEGMNVLEVYDVAGNVTTIEFVLCADPSSAPTATVKPEPQFTTTCDDGYDMVSFKLFDADKIDRVVINGVEKDLTDNKWSDVNFLKPGVFGAVAGENTMVVYDVKGNNSTYTFFLCDTPAAPEMCYLPFTVSFAAESDDMTYSTTAGADGLVISTTTNGYTVGLYDDGRDGVYRVKGTITFPAGVVTADFMFTEAAGDNGLEQTHATYPDVANMVDNTIEFDLFVNGADDVFTIVSENMVAEENCDLVVEEPVTTATVTMCKVDQNDNPLSGWQLALLGDKVEDVVVLPNGTLYNSSVLPAGDYVLVGTGTYEYRGSTGLLSDSLFSDRLPGEAIAATVWEDTWALLATEHLGIRIDGTLAPWGTVFSPLHQYFAAYTANGVDPIDFMVTDTDYSDNKNSSLSVAVHNGYTGITGEDGCVVFADVPVGDYEVAELLQTDWENVSGLGAVEVDEATETFTVVNSDGSEPEPAKLATVTMCKVNDKDVPLAGWTLMLEKGGTIDDLVVPANSMAGVDTTVSLDSLKSYIAQVMGTWTNNRTPINEVDAEYSTEDGWVTQMDGFTGYGPNILELQIDNAFVNWGPYNASHTYAASFMPTATGMVNVRVFDGNDPVAEASWYSDNSGSLDVSISEGYAGVTGADGCVVFENVPYGDYVVDEIAQTGWENMDGLGAVVVDGETETFTVVNQWIDEVGGGDDATTTISGFKYELVDASEVPRAGWVISLFDNEGVEIASTTTAGDGSYNFDVYYGASYTVEEAIQTDWEQVSATTTGDGAMLITHLETGVTFCEFTELYVGSDDPYTCDFVNERIVREPVATTTISGFKFEVIDGIEVPKEDWMISLFDTEDTLLATTTTATDGSYSFVVDMGSNYAVVEEERTGWTQDGVIVYNGEREDGKTADYCYFDLTPSEHLSTFTISAVLLPPAYKCNFYNSQTVIVPDEEEVESSRGGRSSGTRTGGRLGTAGPTPLVLGASTTLCPFLLDYQQKNWNNDTWEVTKLQLFLNIFKDIYGGVENPVDGVFGDITEANVMAFQQKYAAEVLQPWYQQGIVPHNKPTGFVYKTTLWKINSLVCPDDAILPTYEGENLQTNVVVH